MKKNRITIDDVAKALGISKTTVSRAISGRGRIGEDTRERVLEYIKENNYRPSPIAKGLAEKRTYNIAVVWPIDYGYTDLPFFHRCVAGMNRVTSVQGYDILICMIKGDDIGELERVVEYHKVDGVVLTRTLVKDPAAEYLLSCGFPFVAIGSSDDEDIVTVDNDHFRACMEITSILATHKTKRIALIGGDTNHVITQTRYSGFVEGMKKSGAEVAEELVRLDVDSERQVAEILSEYRRYGVECVICMDDMLCDMFLRCCRNEGIAVPGDIKVASFYDSRLLDNADPPVSALHFEDISLGQKAAGMLLDLIEGKKVSKELINEYEVILKGSTK